MPALMPPDTAAALGPNAEKCDSRSLLLDRFCDATAKEKDRHQVFTRAMAKSAIKAKAGAWNSWLGASKAATVFLHAQLQSRLMVNMAGGVMENAGLCLDRFGLPYIPGSAVKGCARRAALAALREWCSAGGQPDHKPTSPDNPLAPCCTPFNTPVEMLAAIARVFGWSELDWSDRPDQSDFRWASAQLWPTLREQARPLLGSPPAKDFAGSVSFLPAYPADLGKTGHLDGLPLDLPPLGKLELDVVTCHHREYYAEPVEPKDVTHSHEKWQCWKREHDAWERQWGTAPDTEEPVPVVFPAVAPGHVFTFALAPLRNINDPSHPSDPPTNPVTFARAALRTGLETFGLGAKTNAGYGWFADVTNAVESLIAAEKDRLAHEAAKKAAEQKAAADAAAKAAAEAERLAKAPPHEKARAEYAKLADEPFAAQAKKFAEMTDEQRHGFVLALKERRDAAKRWSKKKPELLKPWQEFAQKLQPPIQLP